MQLSKNAFSRISYIVFSDVIPFEVWKINSSVKSELVKRKRPRLPSAGRKTSIDVKVLYFSRKTAPPVFTTK